MSVLLRSPLPKKESIPAAPLRGIPITFFRERWGMSVCENTAIQGPAG